MACRLDGAKPISEPILLIGPSWTYFCEILIKIHAFSFKKMQLKISPGKRCPFCLCLSVFKAIALHLLHAVIITRISTGCSISYSRQQQEKHQSSALLAFLSFLSDQWMLHTNGQQSFCDQSNSDNIQIWNPWIWFMERGYLHLLCNRYIDN